MYKFHTLGVVALALHRELLEDLLERCQVLLVELRRLRVLLDALSSCSAWDWDDLRQTLLPTVGQDPPQRDLPCRVALLGCQVLHGLRELQVLVKELPLEAREILEEGAFFDVFGTFELSRLVRR